MTPELMNYSAEDTVISLQDINTMLCAFTLLIDSHGNEALDKRSLVTFLMMVHNQQLELLRHLSENMLSATLSFSKPA